MDKKFSSSKEKEASMTTLGKNLIKVSSINNKMNLLHIIYNNRYKNARGSQFPLLIASLSQFIVQEEFLQDKSSQAEERKTEKQNF